MQTHSDTVITPINGPQFYSSKQNSAEMKLLIMSSKGA